MRFPFLRAIALLFPPAEDSAAWHLLQVWVQVPPSQVSLRPWLGPSHRGPSSGHCIPDRRPFTCSVLASAQRALGPWPTQALRTAPRKRLEDLLRRSELSAVNRGSQGPTTRAWQGWPSTPASREPRSWAGPTAPPHLCSRAACAVLQPVDGEMGLLEGGPAVRLAVSAPP